jgi:hypothetical protein
MPMRLARAAASAAWHAGLEPGAFVNEPPRAAAASVALPEPWPAPACLLRQRAAALDSFKHVWPRRMLRLHWGGGRRV